MERRVVLLTLPMLFLSAREACAHVAPAPLVFALFLPFVAIACFIGLLIKKFVVRWQSISTERVSLADLIPAMIVETVSISVLLAITYYFVDNYYDYFPKGWNVTKILWTISCFGLNDLILLYPHMRLLRSKGSEREKDALLLGLIAPGFLFLLLLFGG